MLNRREQLAVAVLTCTLVLGSVVALVDYYRPGAVEDLRIVPGAVPCPAAAVAPAAAAEAPPAAPAAQAAGARGPAAPLAAPAAAAAAPAAADSAPGPIALNVATAAELEALPGIGPALAARIVAHRTRHGPFARVADLRQVPGIGPRILARLEPLLRLEPESAGCDSTDREPGKWSPGGPSLPDSS